MHCAPPFSKAGSHAFVGRVSVVFWGGGEVLWLCMEVWTGASTAGFLQVAAHGRTTQHRCTAGMPWSWRQVLAAVHMQPHLWLHVPARGYSIRKTSGISARPLVIPVMTAGCGTALLHSLPCGQVAAGFCCGDLFAHSTK